MVPAFEAFDKNGSVEEVTSNDGTTIGFDRSGEGPPIVIVGGALSDRSGAAAVASLLARRFTTIAYDRRGRGDSGDTAPYAVAREVEDIEALIVAAGGLASVYGHSSGAVLALEAARMLPDRITKLALYEPPLIVDDSRDPVPEDFVTRLDALISADRRGDAVAYFLTTGPGMPAEVVAGMRHEPIWSSFESIAHTLSYDGSIVRDATGGDPGPLRRWASVGVPTLVMDGGASPDWIRNAASALTEVLPDAERRTLEGQDHGPDSRLLAPALEAFFAG